MRDALFPARRKQGGIRTAAALHNVGEEAIEVTCWLMSGGVVLEETTISLQPNGQTELDFAHFANGTGIVSELVFVNVETRPSGRGATPFHPTVPESRPVIYFYDQRGQKIAPESVLDVTDDLEVRDDSGLTLAAAMEPLGELTVATHGQGPLVSGAVKVMSEGPIGGCCAIGVTIATVQNPTLRFAGPGAIRQCPT